MKKTIAVILIALVMVGGFASFSFGAEELPKEKQTKLGLYVTAQEAYSKWKADEENVKIIDCRTPEEYIFVGHAPMAHNIPSKFLIYQYNAEKKKPVMKENPDFATLVKAKFKSEDTIMIMCCAGVRSADAVNKLADAGFKKVYNITDGFEGGKVEDKGSYFNGKRMKNGWKNSVNPWTYKLDPGKMYISDNK